MSWKNVFYLTLGFLLVTGCQTGFDSDFAAEQKDQVWVERLTRGLEEEPNVTAPQTPLVDLKAFEATPPTATNLHQLVQERYPETVSLPDLIRNLGKSEEGRSLLLEMLGSFQSITGSEIKPEQVDQILEHPEIFLDMMQFTPGQLGAARDVASQIFAGIADMKRPDVPLPSILKNEFYLPQFFDYDSADDSTYEVLDGELIPIIDGVYFGVLRDPMFTEDELRRNFIFAEVIERLGLNASASPDQMFVVSYSGRSYTRLSSFLQALLDDGHEMRAIVRHYVAPFFPVYTKGQDGELKPVAATAFLRTGILDSKGIEAALPLFHSEFVFYVNSTEKTYGRGINAAVQFYQGIPKTGFYGEGQMDRPLWLGEVISDDAFTSEEAAIAMLLGGYLVDVVRDVAEERQLPFDGWGLNGVCNDSASVIQQAVHGKVSSYPLFMPDAPMTEALTARMETILDNSGSYLDFVVYWLLRRAILDTPEDIEPTPDALSRLLTSFPWEAGEEPFYSVIDASRIIAEHVQTMRPESVDSNN